MWFAGKEELGIEEYSFSQSTLEQVSGSFDWNSFTVLKVIKLLNFYKKHSGSNRTGSMG